MGAGTAWSQLLPCRIQWHATASSCCLFKTLGAPPSSPQVSLEPNMPCPSTTEICTHMNICFGCNSRRSLGWQAGGKKVLLGMSHGHALPHMTHKHMPTERAPGFGNCSDAPGCVHCRQLPALWG